MNFFDRIFLLSKAEKNGAIVLLFIILLLLIVRISLPLIVVPDKNKSYVVSDMAEQFDAKADSIVLNSISKDSIRHTSANIQYSKKAIKDQRPDQKSANIKKLDKFNPNTCSYEEFVNLGFSGIVARNLINYRSKGGVIKKPKDLKKIYGMDSIFFETILPYIIVSEAFESQEKIDINSADSAMFTKLEGIGPVFASRICKYRNQLGGFVSIEQLKEVYKFPLDTYNGIADLLTVDVSKVKKINVNFSGINDLKSHPYCKYANARKIIDFRSKTGYIKNLESLLKDNVLDSVTFKQLLPYLNIE